MAGINKLSARAVETLKKPGRHADGGNLYLKIRPNGGKAWVLFYRSGKKTMREMSLGSYPAVTLAAAREKASEFCSLLEEGKDPLDHRRQAQAAESARLTFGQFAAQLIESKGAAWRNAKHRTQWQQTLATQAASLTPMAVDAVQTKDVLAALKPIWTQTPETAQRLRGRIEAVLDFARCHGAMPQDTPNPARWKGHLEHLLPKASKLTRGHHAAMAYGNLPAFMALLREQAGIGALALEFTILTAARSGEVRGATWSEIDLEGRVWVIPGQRMKAGREHRVPLCDRAIAILGALQPMARNSQSPVFPGSKNRPLSDMTLSAVLRRMDLDGVTVHGFRSSFRDWAGDVALAPRETAEACLAHATGDATEQAYRRSDALEKRRALMSAWERHICVRTALEPR